MCSNVHAKTSAKFTLDCEHLLVQIVIKNEDILCEAWNRDMCSHCTGHTAECAYMITPDSPH